MAQASSELPPLGWETRHTTLGRGQVEKVDLLRYFWKIDLEKIYFFYFFDLYFCFLKAFFGLK